MKTIKEYEAEVKRLEKIIAEQIKLGTWKTDGAKMNFVNGMIMARHFFDLETPVFLNRNGGGE